MKARILVALIMYLGAITLMVSSTCFAMFSGPLEKIDCRSSEAGIYSLISIPYAEDVIQRPVYEPEMKAGICSKTGTLFYIHSQNEVIATMNNQDSDPMLRELGAAYRRYRPELTIKPFLQYCANKISLKAALDGYRSYRSNEDAFGKEVDRITTKYMYSPGSRCGHHDPAYGGEG